MKSFLRVVMCWSFVLVMLTACEAAYDPSTGQTRTQVFLPGTQANQRNLERQWYECTRFYSPTVCQRRIGWRGPLIDPPVDDDK